MELLLGIAASVIAAALCALAVRVYQKVRARWLTGSQAPLPVQTLRIPPSTEEKRVYKTFLFTDIVKSTDIRAACIREFGDKGNERYDNEVLAPHDAILDHHILQFNGEVISTAGDSYFTAFPSARDAVQCAVAIQRIFVEKKIPLPHVESNLPRYLQIRIGLHTGPARELLRAGKPNYSDHTINIAARIEGLAGGEQVLMSRETWNNVGRLEGLTKHEWEGYALKGVDDVWTLVEALWDGRNPLRPQISPAAPSPTSVATVEAFAIFGGRVEIVTDELLSHPASSNRLQQFYAGAKLDWDIIAAHGDIPRDQQGELLEQASQPCEGMRLICLVAEAGAGKSTLAWRAAADLHQQHKALVIHIKDSDDADLWYRFPEFCTKVGRPFFVLVDDIFHDPDSVSAFYELSPWLPITVLATSRPNEYRARRLKCEALRLNLKPPSPDEKERLLQRLGKSRSDLTAEQQRRLDAANQFLVLMMEVVAGKELREIVRDTIERLCELDEPAHHAYEYLCFAYQHTIAIPASLLERLDAHGRFHNLPERDTTQGLIFWDSREGYLRVGHPVIAETAARFYAQHRSPQAVLIDIATAVDTTFAPDRRFFAHLLRVLAQIKSPILMTMPTLLESGITRCALGASRITELTIWRSFYRYRGQHQEAEQCVDSALTLEPISSPDCNRLLSLYRERGKEQDALPAIAKWVRDHPERGEERVAYVRLIERYGTANDVETVLQEINVWLAAHPDDNSVRQAYLGFVERKGTPEQVAQVVQEIGAWLAAHPDDNSVRQAYLRFVERKGTPEQVAQVVQEIGAWLAAHPEDVNVRERYLGFIERKGTPEQIAQVVTETKAWLAAHLEDVNVRSAWLNLVEMRGSDDIKEAALADTKTWLAAHSSAKEIWRVLLGWLFRAGRSSEAVELLMTAISHHPNDRNLLIHYLRVVQDSADEQTSRRIYEQLVAKYDRDQVLHANYARWLHEHGYHEEAAALYQGLIAKAPRSYLGYYGYGVLLLKLKRFVEAAIQFREVLNIHRGHQMAHDGLAWALWKLGDHEQAEREFRSAIYWADMKEQPQKKFCGDLGWFYLDRKRWRDALNAFESARDEDPDYYGNYWGIGWALRELGDYAAAADALRTALEKEPALEPPASEEISELLQQCLAHLSSG